MLFKLAVVFLLSENLQNELLLVLRKDNIGKGNVWVYNIVQFQEAVLISWNICSSESRRGGKASNGRLSCKACRRWGDGIWLFDGRRGFSSICFQDQSGGSDVPLIQFIGSKSVHGGFERTFVAEAMRRDDIGD